MNTTPTARPIGSTRDTSATGEAALLLARSFHDQPHFEDMFPSAAGRRRALPHVFAAVLTDAATHGHVDTIALANEIAGVAIWYPQGTYPLTVRRQVRVAPAALRMVAAAPRAVSRVMRFQAMAARLHPPQPYWYLAAIGVDPARQGTGVGSRLLRHGLDRVDGDGSPAYLETHTQRGVDWYTAHGFEVRRAAVPFTPDGPPNWTMLRPRATR